MFEEIKTSTEAATILNMTQRNVSDLCSRGKFPGAVKKGKAWLIPETSVKLYTFTHGNKRQRKEAAQKKEAVRP